MFSEAELKERLDQFPEVLSDDKFLTVKKPDPDKVLIIASSTLLVLEKNVGSLTLILYLTLQEVLKQEASFKHDETKLGFVFSYYLESYRLIRASSQPEEKTLQAQLLYTEALLSFFDLYFEKGQDILVRRLLAKALEAMHHVMTAYQASDTRLQDASYSFKKSINYLSNIALITQTIKEYLKGKKRLANDAYVHWLKDFFTKALYTQDLTFIDTHPHFSQVIKQLSHKAKTISLKSQ